MSDKVDARTVLMVWKAHFDGEIKNIKGEERTTAIAQFYVTARENGLSLDDIDPSIERELLKSLVNYKWKGPKQQLKEWEEADKERILKAKYSIYGPALEEAPAITRVAVTKPVVEKQTEDIDIASVDKKIKPYKPTPLKDKLWEKVGFEWGDADWIMKEDGDE